MIKKILIGIGVVFLLFVLWAVYGLFIATPASPQATASYNEGGLEISVVYSQPSKKGRLIFGEEEDGALQPYGKYWRLGANAATEITFNKDVNFGGEPIKAGTYRMYAVPGPNAFTVTLNSETSVFFGVAEPDPELDIVTVEAPVQKPMAEVETFTIAFSETEISETEMSATDMSEADATDVSEADSIATEMSEQDTRETGMSTTDSGVTINFSWDQTLFTVPVAIQ